MFNCLIEGIILICLCIFLFWIPDSKSFYTFLGFKAINQSSVKKEIDILIFDQIRRGSFKDFETLFEKYYSPLCHFSVKYVQDDFIAEDIVQEVFAKIWEDKEKIRIQESVKSYLYTAVRNRSLNKLKSQTTREEYTKSYSQNADQIVDLDEIEQEEFRLFLAQCIEKLPPRCKDVFVRSRFDDMKQDAIASEMGIAVKTVKAQVGKALKLLRDCLSVSYSHFF